jgi:hypothetical protein
MEKIEIIRERYQEARNAYNTDKNNAYYEGKMVGIVEGVAYIMGISWIEAEVLITQKGSII